jgi:hypothetical protein
MELLSFEKKHGIFTLVAKNRVQTTTVKWSPDLQTLTYDTPQHYVDRDGNARTGQILNIGPSPIYLIEKSD